MLPCASFVVCALPDPLGDVVDVEQIACVHICCLVAGATLFWRGGGCNGFPPLAHPALPCLEYASLDRMFSVRM